MSNHGNFEKKEGKERRKILKFQNYNKKTKKILHTGDTESLDQCG